jgi:hypothetical protein
VDVTLSEGFLVLGNPALKSMYSCVLCRACLDKVPGCVLLFLQTFLQMLLLQQGINTAATMPVRIAQPGAASPAAVAAEPPLFACGAFAGDPLVSSRTSQGADEDATGQGTGTTSSSEVLHFFKRQPQAGGQVLQHGPATAGSLAASNAAFCTGECSGDCAHC